MGGGVAVWTNAAHRERGQCGRDKTRIVYREGEMTSRIIDNVKELDTRQRGRGRRSRCPNTIRT